MKNHSISLHITLAIVGVTCVGELEPWYCTMCRQQQTEGLQVRGGPARPVLRNGSLDPACYSTTLYVIKNYPSWSQCFPFIDKLIITIITGLMLSKTCVNTVLHHTTAEGRLSDSYPHLVPYITPLRAISATWLTWLN